MWRSLLGCLMDMRAAASLAVTIKLSTGCSHSGVSMASELKILPLSTHLHVLRNARSSRSKFMPTMRGQSALRRNCPCASLELARYAGQHVWLSSIIVRHGASNIPIYGRCCRRNYDGKTRRRPFEIAKKLRRGTLLFGRHGHYERDGQRACASVQKGGVQRADI